MRFEHFVNMAGVTRGGCLILSTGGDHGNNVFLDRQYAIFNVQLS